jgi:C1A family cysteine protease
LLQYGPVAIALSADNWNNYYGIGLLSCYPGATINHAVLLIGYTPNYWIIKNQWGTKWGNHGFANITRKASANCGIGYAVFTMY